MSEPPIQIPEPTGVFAEPWSTRKCLRLMAAFGPAAIVASVAIGAGETIVVVSAGAWASYDLLWLVMLSVLVKGICVTYLLGRYTAVSGEPIGQRLVRLPGPRGWLLIAIIVLEFAAAGPLWAAIVRPCGELLFHVLQSAVGQLSYPKGPAVISTIMVVSILIMSLRQSYDRLERQQVIICGVLVVGTIVGTIIVGPNIWEALCGLFNFGQLPESPPEWAPAAVRERPYLTLATTFGYVGGTVMTYAVYAQWIGNHGWGISGHNDIETIRRRASHGAPSDYLPVDHDSVQRMRRLLAPLRWDVAIGAAVLAIVSMSFMMAGAAVLYPLLAAGKVESAFSDWRLLTDQAHIWHGIHPWLVWVYYVCVLAALWGTLNAYPEIYSRITQEYCAAIWPGRDWSFKRIQRIVCAYVAVVSVPLLWIDVSFQSLTGVVAFLATNLAIALLMLAAIYLNFQLPRPLRTRWWMLLAAIASAAILIIVSCVSGWGIWQSLR